MKSQIQRTLPTPPSAFRLPRCSLRKGLAAWELTFNGQRAILKHQRGILYVAHLVMNPPDHPIHALDLAAKIPEIYRRQLGLPQIFNLATGQPLTLDSHARIQERSLAIDDAQAARALQRKEKQLEATLNDEFQTETVKQHALRDLEAIAEFQKRHARRSSDNTERVVRAVRRAITRLHQRLTKAIDRRGNPHPVLRPFAAHLQKHLLIPSVCCARYPRSRARASLAGCFTYEPPPGVFWTD